MSELSTPTWPRQGSRQYHIDLEPGELSEYILLVGDRQRVPKVAARFDSVEFERSHREITSATGSIGGMRLSVMSSGMGPDNIEIVMAEILEITQRPTIVRVGSSGGLQPHIGLGDLVISIGAVRLENTTDFYVHPGYPAIADRQVVQALEEACQELGYTYHVGLTATAPGFFAPQGRAMRTLPVRYPDLTEDLRRQGVANLEMESSALFVLAALSGSRAGTVCAVYAQRTDGTFVDDAARESAEARCIDAGLAGIQRLWQADASRDAAQ